MEFVFIGAYLVLGWAFTYWLRNYFLIDGRWGSGEDFGIGSALLVNIAWVGILLALIAMGIVWFVFTILPKCMRKMYGIK